MKTTNEYTAYWWDIGRDGKHIGRAWFTDPEVARVAIEALTAQGYRCTSQRGPGENGTATIRETR